jgi:hypothetical protein
MFRKIETKQKNPIFSVEEGQEKSNERKRMKRIKA